jgi:uncharacterized protein
MEDRDWYISTSGRGIQIINDARINEIKNGVVSYLSRGDYYGAFAKFISMTEGYLSSGVIGSEGGNLAVIWIAAFVIALISVLFMAAQLKTARPKPAANDYAVQNSFHLTHKRDIFINTHTVRTPRPKQNSGGGGSTVHRSSSGRSHGGGGGKF